MNNESPAKTGEPNVSLLAAALSEAAAESVTVQDLVRLTGGASRETWLFTQISSQGSRPLVLRRDPPGRPGLPGSMRREAEVIRAAHNAGLAVPEVFLVDDGKYFGTAGLIMEHVPGETRARRILSDELYGHARTMLTAQVAEFLAGLHAIDPASVEGLTKPDPLEELQTAYDLIGQRRPIFDLAFTWLRGNRPEVAQSVIVHGDLRTGNLIVDESGLRAAIDWELVHVGDPLEDLSWLCVKAWRFREPAPVGGFGQLEELFTAYEKAGGGTVDRQAFNWWLVLNTLKWGVMCLTQADAHLAGLVRSVELAAIGRRAAEQEWDLCELLAPKITAGIVERRRSEFSALLEERDGVKADSGELTNEEVDGGFYGRPTAVELLEAIGEFLTNSVMGVNVPSTAFHARVSANLVESLQRQLRMGHEHSERYSKGLKRLGLTSNRELSERLRTAEMDLQTPGLINILAEAAFDRLLVGNPRHLGT